MVERGFGIGWEYGESFFVQFLVGEERLFGEGDLLLLGHAPVVTPRKGPQPFGITGILPRIENLRMVSARVHRAIFE
jgi:hypothetical protein